MLRKLLRVLIAAFAIAGSVSAQPREASSFDRYGYQASFGNSAQCPYDYIDAGGGNRLP